uniref:Uncharacterized protein n=1 Tax=Glossina pallidipes TaxID=7398 RepID=A0A1A9ZZQ7_GLOPL
MFIALSVLFYYTMVKMPDSLFSPLFKEYSDLWNTGNNLCRAVCGKLADRLRKEMGVEVTAEDVIKKIYAIRLSLRRVDKRQGGQTRMGHYLWYARKLGLAGAVKIIKRHKRNYKNLQINTDNTDSENEEPFLMDVQDTVQIDERITTPVGNIDITNINIVSPDTFADNSGPSTSAHGRLIEQLKKVNHEIDELQRRLAVYEGQVVGPQPDSFVLDVKEPREVVKCLTTEDKNNQTS